MNTRRVSKDLPIVYNELTICFLLKFNIFPICLERIFNQFFPLKRIQRLLHVDVFSMNVLRAFRLFLLGNLFV